MTPSHPIFGVTFSSGYTAYWDADSATRAERRARPWVKILGSVVKVALRRPGPRLAGEV